MTSERPSDYQVAAAYDAVATEYAETLRDELSGKPLDRALLGALVEMSHDSRIADIGCGPGHVTRYLASLGAKPIGIDISPAMIEIARAENPDLEFKVETMTDLTEPDQSLSAAVLLYSIINLSKTERERSFAQILPDPADRRHRVGVLSHSQRGVLRRAGPAPRHVVRAQRRHQRTLPGAGPGDRRDRGGRLRHRVGHHPHAAPRRRDPDRARLRPGAAARARLSSRTSVQSEALRFLRRARKNLPSSSAHSCCRTPPTASSRCGLGLSATTFQALPHAPALGSQAPKTRCEMRDCMIAPAHIRHGSRVTTIVHPSSR